MRSLLALSLLFVGPFPSNATDAGHFTIHLEVKSGKEAKKVDSKVAPQADSRPVLTVQTAKRIQVSWTVTASSKSTDKDVLIHLFVVRESKTGQAAVPKLDKDVPAETAMTMDFQPQDKASGTLEFQIDTPGTYLMRIETRGDAEGAAVPEQFVAIDLVVQ